MCGINNVKISIVFQSFLPISHFIKKASTYSVICSQKRNFLVIKDNVSITVFKKSENQFHLNVTGIKTLWDVNSVINTVTMKYCPLPYFKFLYHKVDNLTATYTTGYTLPLQKIALHLSSCNYNTE